MKICSKIFFLWLAQFVAFQVATAAPFDSVARKGKSRQYIGFEAGLATPHMTGTDLDLQLSRPGATFNNKAGFQAGVIFKNEFTRSFYAKTGFVYSEQKGQIEHSTFSPNSKIESAGVYVPLLFGLQLADASGAGKVKIGIECGASVSFPLRNDNLERGLYPGQDIHKPGIIPAFILGGNFELFFSEKIGGFFNYRFSKDLNYYFSRRYTWHNDTLNKDVYKDYDVWMQCSSVTVGLFFRVDTISH
jgi:hypothetical protein